MCTNFWKPWKKRRFSVHFQLLLSIFWFRTKTFPKQQIERTHSPNYLIPYFCSVKLVMFLCNLNSNCTNLTNALFAKRNTSFSFRKNMNFKKPAKHAQNAEMHCLFLSETTSEMLNFKKTAKMQNMHKMHRSSHWLKSVARNAPYLSFRKNVVRNAEF
jgi:chlorite dismutase